MIRSKVLESIEQLNVFADPTRVEIIEQLRIEPCSPQQLAKRLNVQRTRLYHHFGILEKHGFIEVTAETRKRGTVERTYAPSYDDISVDPRLFGSEQAISKTFAAVLDQTRSELASLEEEPRHGLPLLLERIAIRASESNVRKLHEQLKAFIEACNGAHRSNGKHSYAMTVAFYPKPGGSRTGST